MWTILTAALDTAAHIQGITLPVLLGGIVAGSLRLHWLAGGRRG